MNRRHLLFMLGLIISVPFSGYSKDVSSHYTNQNKPLRHYLAEGILISETDSLFVNQKLLNPGVDYKYNKIVNAFELGEIVLSDNDTLYYSYKTAPEWLKSFYGRSLPAVGEVNSQHPVTIPSADRGGKKNVGSVNFSGSKTFRVSSNNANSNFGQSLDLRIDGKLTEKVKISGAVSDRGYNSEYGTFNGRINELDKIKLRIFSDQYSFELGETSLSPGQHQKNKQLSGLSFVFDNQKLNIFSAIARPKGKYESIQLNGSENRQGPYRINANNRFQPVVPGSETVWLDGVRLKKGTDNDYHLDYSSGEIIFNVNHPITAQSRIEIDYEPVENSYRQEYYAFGGGLRSIDSSYYFQAGFIREGDNKDDFLLDSFNDTDRELLETVGDNRDLAIRSGVKVDSVGSYLLLVDSLPDSVYQYVGEGDGDLAIIFSYVGENRGDYRFVGGGQYHYVGEDLGEYLPVVNVPLPQRTDYISLNGGVNHLILGQLDMQLNLSSFDQNLLSALNDGDNQSWAGKIDWHNDWVEKNQLIIRVRHQDNDFKSKERIFTPDVARRFYAPDKQLLFTRRTLYDFLIKNQTTSAVSLDFNRAHYKYGDSFDADNTSLEMRIKFKDDSYLSNRGTATLTEFQPGDENRVGRELSYLFDSQFKLSPKLALKNSYDFHRRTNDYFEGDQKIITNRAHSQLASGLNLLGVEYYHEDSTEVATVLKTERSTVYLALSQKYKNYSLATKSSLRKIKSNSVNETVFLNRLKINYRNTRRHLSWGADYLTSSETRNSRGITYLKVTGGEGDYILEDGNYISDLNGDYIRLEEILSDQSKVKRGEKSFYLTKANANMMFRFQSDIDEELLNNESRKLIWVLPFYSDKDKGYFYFNRHYLADLKIITIKGGYALNLKFDLLDESRTISSELKEKSDLTASLILRQSYRQAFFETGLELFENKRDQYYNGGNDGKINGYKVELKYIQQSGRFRITSGVNYRSAKTEFDEESKIISLLSRIQRQILNQGEIRGELELYTNDLKVNSSSSIFLLTNNQPGDKGARWSLLLRYGLKKDIKLNLSVNGRHADNRTARITGRAELVAGF